MGCNATRAYAVWGRRVADRLGEVKSACSNGVQRQVGGEVAAPCHVPLPPQEGQASSAKGRSTHASAQHEQGLCLRAAAPSASRCRPLSSERAQNNRMWPLEHRHAMVGWPLNTTMGNSAHANARWSKLVGPKLFRLFTLGHAR